MRLSRLLQEAGLTCPEEYGELEITGLEYDSRRVKKGYLFVCLKGRQTDGHIFALDAAFKGAAAVVAEEPLPLAGHPLIIAPDTRKALPALAAAFYEHPSKDMTLFGVTGTNGKTSITYMLRSILKETGNNCGLIGTIAYRYGERMEDAPRTTPESADLQRLFYEMKQQGILCCTMEVSSHGLALGRVDGIRFDYSVFSNLTQDHLDFHENLESYYQAKKKLFLQTEKAGIINIDNHHGLRLYEELKQEGRHPVSYSIHDPKTDYFGSLIETSQQGLRFEMKCAEQVLGEISLKTPGIFSMYNGLAAAACCLTAGFTFEQVAAGLSALPGVPGRFELVENHSGVIAVVDYAHTPDALEMALKTAADLARGRLICVFGCGGDRDKGKRPLMGRAAGEFSDYVIVTSDNPRSEDPEIIASEIESGLYETGCNYEMIPSRREAIGKAVAMYQKGDVILVAGKGHENYQIIGAAKNYFSDRETVKQFIEERSEEKG